MTGGEMKAMFSACHTQIGQAPVERCFSPIDKGVICFWALFAYVPHFFFAISSPTLKILDLHGSLLQLLVFGNNSGGVSHKNSKLFFCLIHFINCEWLFVALKNCQLHGQASSFLCLFVRLLMAKSYQFSYLSWAKQNCKNL